MNEMEEETDFLKLPIEERCLHKSWKARISGYEDALKLFQQSDEKNPDLLKYSSLIKKFVIDSNAAAQEKGISAALAFVENAACANKACSEVISGIITKGLAASKTRTRELSCDVILMYIEIEKQDTVEDELIKGLDNKSPKVVAACISILREALCLFGSQIVALKPIVKVLPKLLEDRDKSIRDESKQLCVQVYRWVGDPIKPQLQNLKPLTLTELEGEFEKVKGERPMPTRYIRSQQEKMSKAVAEDVLDSGESAKAEVAYVAPEIDPFDLMSSIDLLEKLPKDFYEQCEAKKWQERKDALENLQQISTNVKLEAGDYGELIRTLKKMIAKDTNVLVVGLATKCLINLIVGLRKKFSPYSGQCVPVIFEKFKEKKQNIVQNLREAIDAIYGITNLENLMEDIQAALANKNPQIRAESVAFLTRCFCKCNANDLNKKILKSLCTSLIKTLNDTDGAVRENSAEALGTALKVTGERVMGPFLQEVDALKMTKVKECCDKAVITAKPQVVEKKVAKVAPQEAPKATSAPPGPIKALPNPAIRSATFTRKAGPSSALRSKLATKLSKPTSAKKSSSEAPEPEFTEAEMTEEDVANQIQELLPNEVINGLGSSNWKERLASAEKFFEIIQQAEKGSLSAQALIKVLAKKPGFKENNFQILKLRFEILAYIADNVPISRISVESCLADVVDKIGDIKNGTSAGAALTSLAGATSLEYISLAVLNIAFNQKNPRNQAEALVWLSTSVKQFGLKVQVKEVIDYLKKAFASNNPTVKSAALTLLGTLFMYMGKNLRTFFEDEKPVLLQLIDSEYEKVKDLKPPLPERGLKDSSPSGEGSKANNQVNLNDLIPRVDISSQITQQIITDLSDKDWHLRQDALQKVSSIIADAKFITPNLGDLPMALKPRITDTNKKLAVSALSLCQLLGSALGPHCSKQLRNFSSGILSALGDNKSHVRAAAVQCLNTWMENCPITCLFEGETVLDALRTDNPLLRIEVFSWLTEKLPSATSVSVQELNQCVPLLFTCLEDRSVDVRKKAADCLQPVMLHVGYEPMVRCASKLKPASKANVVAQLDKLRPSVPEKATGKSKLPSSKLPISGGRGSPPSPGDEDSGIPSASNIKGRLNHSISKNKLMLKPNIAPAKTKKEEDVDTSPPLMFNNLKDQRIADEKNLRVLRWNFTSPREEFYLQLKDQMITANCSRTLVSHFFHNDFKFHIKAIDILSDCVASDPNTTIANLDLILKWLALRFFDTNPSVLLKALDYLQMLFEMLLNQRYRLLEAEASSFVPYLILKIGDPKDPVRKGVKEIIKLSCSVHPASKMFSYIMQGLSSKNARQRAECLDELGILIESNGLAVCQPSPAMALKEIAKQISDRDNSVRNAALNCVVQAYFIEGEKVYKYVGSLSDKDMSLLEERIKRSSKSRPTRALQDGTPQSSRVSPPMMSIQKTSEDSENRYQKEATPRPLSKGPLTLDLEDIETMFKKEPESKLLEPVPVNADEILNLPDIQLPQTRLRPPASALKLLNNSSEASTAVNLVMAQLAAQEIPVVMEAFAQVEELLRQDDRAEAVMGSRVDQLLVMGALQYRLAHNKHMADENICKADVIRLYRGVTLALMTLFDNSALARKASRDVLRDLIPHLITVILDSRLTELQDGTQVVRTINILIVRILMQSNPTNITSALIKLLHDCVGNMNVSDRFTDLIMKCLWKMIRIFKRVINDLDVDRILLDVHIFLKAYPSSSWKERSDDTPVRTVKTILYTLSDIIGEDVMKHLILIPNRQESDLYPYLQKILKMKEKSDRSKDSKSSQEDVVYHKEGHKRSRPASLKLSKSTHEALTEIFKKIGIKDQTKEGLYELYEFMNNHPEANIEPFLQRSSDFFQNYIRQGIKQIENERREFDSGHGISSGLVTSPDVVPKCDLPVGNANEMAIGVESWRDTFPPIPPVSMDTTSLDWAEWLKMVVARMNMDTSKYDDPVVMNAILRIKPENDEPYNEEQMANLYKDLERLRSVVSDLKSNTV